MEKVLITGIGGLAGYHLTNLLNGRYRVFGFDHKPDNGMTYLRDVDYSVIDISNAKAVERLLVSVAPDYIIHLAAVSSVARSWSDQYETYNVNLLGQLNLLSAAAALSKKPRIMIACSSQEYGAVEEENQPIGEETRLSPDSPYAASKVCQDFMGLQFYLGFGVPIMRSRSFNHTGPGQSEAFVCSDFARQITEIEAGIKEPYISVGNLEARRDFTDVRDVVRAYFLIALKGTPGEAYNVCSGRAYSAGEILDRLLTMSSVKIKVERDPEKNRPTDLPVLIGDYGKIKRDIGWEPQIDMDETLKDLLDWWREKIK